MAKINNKNYVKSVSNYVIQEKHQTTNKGDIFERDITTISGRNFYNKNLRPVYNSGNFIIVSSSESSAQRPPIDTEWELPPKSEFEYWTWDDVKDVSEETDSSAVLELNPDVHDLRSFAYYGSCSELIRGSLNHIVSEFPGELYVTENQIIYKVRAKNDNDEDLYYFINPEDGQPTPRHGEDIGGTIEEIRAQIDSAEFQNKYPYINYRDIHPYIKTDTLGGDNAYLVSNPFGIDIHNTTVDLSLVDENPLKYFSVNDYGKEAYEVFIGETVDAKKIKSIQVIKTFEYCSDDESKGKKVADYSQMYSTIISYDGGSLTIDTYKLEGDNYVYLTNTKEKIHIRPKKQYYNEFKRKLSIFERLLVSDSTIPKYTPTFEIYTENEIGFSITTQQFSFPLADGGYNLGIELPAYSVYIRKFVDIAEMYDEYFCDNLWRSMTHESIKNFDWSFQREINENLEKEHTEGGNKVQKIIRLIGREFDEIKAYADGIGQANKLTYDGHGNMPDYMLTDQLELEGWDYKHVIPFTKKVDSDEFIEYDKDIQPYVRNTKDTVSDCEDTHNLLIPIDTYKNDLFVTPNDVNNQFARLLALNSRGIWKKKGTIEGIESLLALFGFKNKEWVIIHKNNEDNFKKSLTEDRKNAPCPNNDCGEYGPSQVKEGYVPCQNHDNYSIVNGKYDYTIIEKIIRLENDDIIPLTEKERQDWIKINNAKNITYREDIGPNIIPTDWRGLMVKEKAPKTDNGKVCELYPFFEKYEEYDGKPYYQMYGGWLEKQYGLNKNDEFVDETYYTETLKKIKGFNTIQDLLNTPANLLHVGDIAYISDLNHRYLIIDGVPYEVHIADDEDDGTEDKSRWYYFTVLVKDNSVIIGNQIYQDTIHIIEPTENITSSDYNNTIKPLKNYKNNAAIKIYMYYNKEEKFFEFALDGYYGEKYKYVLFINTIKDINGKEKLVGFYPKDGSDQVIKDIENVVPTNYFVLNDINYFKYLNLYSAYSNTQEQGWKQLTEDNPLYQHILTIEDYYAGNNPHTWETPSDSGYEYIAHFGNLFKYSLENNLFDWDWLFKEFNIEDPNDKDDFIEQIKGFGFDILDDNCSTYEKRMPSSGDTKMHYADKKINEIDDSIYYATPKDFSKVTNTEDRYYEEEHVEKQATANIAEPTDTSHVDSDCIINTKKVDIIFHIKPYIEKDNKKIPTEEFKYINSVVIPYLEQMLPSTLLYTIKYEEIKSQMA